MPSVRWLLIGDGRSIHVQRIVSGLAAEGIDVHLASFEALDDLPAQTHELWSPPHLGDLRYMVAIPSIRRLVKRLQPDVVNAHYVTSYGLLAAASGARCVVQTAWGTDLLRTARRPGYRQLTQWILSRASLTTGDSQDLIDAASALAPAVPVHRFVFGPPAAVWVAKDQKHQRQQIIVSVRNHEPLYQIDLILEAWPLVRKKLANHRLLVLGSGSLTEALRTHLPPGAALTGKISHAEVLAALASAQVVVSIPTHDASSAAVLEALASGCAVVASDIPANREWVAKDHLVTSTAHPQELADAIIAAVGTSGTLDPHWAFETQVATLIEGVRAVTGRRA